MWLSSEMGIKRGNYMKIELEIETHDNKLLSDLFEYKDDEWKEKVFKEGVSAKYEGSIERLAEGLPEILIITLEILKDISIGIVSAWLYDKIGGRAVSLKINKTEVEIDHGEIQRIITEEIEKTD